MKNDIKKIQTMVIKQLERLSNDELMQEEGYNEIMRSKAITTTATSYLNSVNTQLKIREAAKNEGVTVENMNAMLGVVNDSI